jgi:hypothetical protein
MNLDDTTIDTIAAFRKYVEDSVANDDRYGAATRCDADDGTVLATRFDAGSSCWFEVVIHVPTAQVRVGFLTTDSQVDEELAEAIRESVGSLAAFVGEGFQEAGLEWESPIVNHETGDGLGFSYTTPIDLDELLELDRDEIRDKVVRMLEGYLVAFGPAVFLDEED